MELEIHSKEIAEEIERLKAHHVDNKALYRELCGVLFFRYGITPTGNKLYSIVRRGTMTTPMQAVTDFWAELRQKARVRIERPDVPQPLLDLAGDTIHTMWNMALSAAQDTFAGERQEFAERISALEGQHAAASRERDELAEASKAHAAALAEKQRTVSELERALAAEQANTHALAAQLEDLKAENARLRADHEAARREFAEQLAAQLAAADARHTALADKAAADVDHERQAARALQDEVERVRQAAAAAEHRQREETAALQRALDDARMALADVRGELRAAQARADVLQQQTETQAAASSDLSLRLARSEHLAQHWEHVAKELQAAAPANSPSVKRKRQKAANRSTDNDSTS